MEFNSDNKIFLKLFNKKKIDIPCESTLHRILVNTDNEALEKVFVNFFAKYVKKKNIAVDGKWLNGSDVNGQYTKEDHKMIFNIFDKDSKIVLAHKFLKKGKLSEIPAFKELLKDDTFNQGGQIFSFDALMTQVDILDTINNANNKYIAKVKSNQKALKDKIELTISSFKNPTEIYEDTYMERNLNVKRKIEIYTNSDCNIVLYDSKNNDHWKMKAEVSLLKTKIDTYVKNFNKEDLSVLNFGNDNIYYAHTE